MKDSEIIKIFLPTLQQSLAVSDFSNAKVVRAYQKKIQGAETSPTVYFYKASDKAYGWQLRKDQWSVGTSQIIHKEEQLYETVFNFQAMVTDGTYTSADLCRFCVGVLQSDKALNFFKSRELGILKITNLGSFYFKDDADNFLYVSSFDCTFLHKNSTLSQEPKAVWPVEIKMYSV